jgi:hypothetical protein
MNKASSPNRKKNDKGISIAIAVIAVLAVIAVIFVMLRGCDDSGSAKNPAAASGIAYDPGAVEGGWNELALWEVVNRYLHSRLPEGVKALPIAA